ncbi:MAG: flippase-like domain-containing protein [Paludibacteraceae bacterium]|nr:flippase-like domain-containing protein [Paludibacteraceae bacterium]
MKKPTFLDKYYKWIKIIIMVSAYTYLGYILYHFDNYEGFADNFSNMSWTRFLFLFFVFVLLPLNLFLESLKWKIILSGMENISIFTAFQSILAGITTGFFTPNRIGDPLGKVLYLQEGNRVQAVALSYVATFGQSFATFLCGIIAGFFLMFSPAFTEYQDSVGLQTTAVLFLLLLIFLYFSLPYIIRKFTAISKFSKLNHLLEAITEISVNRLGVISILSLVRFMVYSSQYYLLLLFFGVDISIYEAVVAIPINYLMVSITPSVAFSELGIRGSYAIIILGAFTHNTPAVVLAGVTVWFINYVIPMITGSLLLTAKKKL